MVCDPARAGDEPAMPSTSFLPAPLPVTDGPAGPGAVGVSTWFPFTGEMQKPPSGQWENQVILPVRPEEAFQGQKSWKLRGFVP